LSSAGELWGWEAGGEVGWPATYLCGRIRLDVVARRHQDQPDGAAGRHDDEALGAAPDVHELRGGQLEDAAEDPRHDAGDGDERVRREVGEDIGGQVAGDLLLQRVDEEDKEDAGPGQRMLVWGWF